jgi:GH24 family phage-related lysozyme (muramidase)
VSDIQISPMKQVPQRAAVLDQAATQSHNYGFGIPAAAPAPDTELAGLVNGLAVLNPALQSYGEQAARTAAEEAHKAGVADANRRDMSGIAEKELLATPLPSSVPPAFDTAYRSGLKSVLGVRAASDTKAAIAQEYDDAKDKPDFDAARFLQDARAKHMAGFADPEMAAKVGAGVNELEVAIRSDVEKKRMEKTAELVDTSFAQLVRDKLDPRGTADSLHAAYVNEILPEARLLGKSQKDSAKALLNRVHEMSNQLGGAPQLYGVFEMKDRAGFAIAAANPELSSQIEAGRTSAKHLLEQGILKDSQGKRLQDFAALDQMRDSNPGAITPALVASRIGQFDLFPTAEAAHSYLQHAQGLAQRQLGLSALQAHWDGNDMSRLPTKEQQDLIEANMGGQMNMLFKAAQAGDPKQVAQLASNIIREASARNVSVPIPAMERFITTLSATGQNKAGPDAGFLARAELYRALSSAPHIRSMYFKDDAEDMMETYTKLTQAGGGADEARAAYAAAYESVSKEAKDRAAQYAKTPEFAKTAKASVDKVLGSSMIPQWLFGSGRPSNPDTVDADVSAAMMSYLRSHPTASHDMVTAYAKGYVASNWVHDESSGVAIKVPPVFANTTTQENLTEFSKRLLKAGRLDEREGNWHVEYRPKGTEGDVDVMLTNGAGSMTPVASTNLAKINQQFFNEKHIDHTASAPGTPPSEGQRLQQLQQQLAAGTVSPAFVEENKQLIAKARILKALPKESFEKLDRLQSDAMLQQLQAVPKLSFGAPDFSTLADIKQRGRARVDAKMTAALARSYVTSAVTGAPDGDSMARGLAASLITMGEGVVTRAYEDPAQGAGRNIGTGYNLNANAANAPTDLKRAGVPEAAVAGVLNGTLQMTGDQVARLTQVSIGKYETIARDTAEKSSAGLWKKMTPQQKAVMIDVAYQVGSVDKFRSAWGALASGNQAEFAKHVETTYVDSRSGERVVDSRRKSLRAAMLGGAAVWDATVNKYGSLPSTALDVAALNK